MAFMKIEGVIKIIASALFLLASLLGGAAWFLVSHYRLPFPAVLPILTALAGPIDFFATYRSMLGLSASSRNKSKRPLPPFLLLLNLLLLILPTILTTYSTPYLGENKCLLDKTWTNWYSAKDARAIGGVQDSFQCCGYSTPKRMAYPFPKGKPGEKGSIGADACVIMRGAGVQACAGPWESELKNAAGLVVGAGAMLGIIKFVFLMLVLGNPKVAERWFVREGYGEYISTRAIEEVDNDDNEEEEEAQVSRFTDEATNGDGADERTRLLLPKANGRDARPINMNDQEAWRS